MTSEAVELSPRQRKQVLVDALGHLDYLKLHWRDKYGNQKKAAEALGWCEVQLSKIATGKIAVPAEILLDAGLVRKVTYEVIE